MRGEVEKKHRIYYTHDASFAFDDHLSEKLAPYDTEKQVPFHPGYLCGFYAEAGDADIETYNQLAKQELSQYSCELIARDSNNLKKTPGNLQFKMEASSIPLGICPPEQVLYPVWFMSYRNKDKITYSTVNGQTGKVGADLPLSPLRILAAVAGVAAALYGLFWLLMQVLPSIKAKTVLGLCALVTLAGLFVMEHAFSRTVGKALHNDIITARNYAKSGNDKALKLPREYPLSIVRYLIAVGLAMVFLIGYASDGSSDRVLGFYMGLLFIIDAVYLLLFHFEQALDLGKLKNLTIKTESSLKSGILSTAKHMLTPMAVMRVFIYLAIIADLVLVIMDLPQDWIYYSLSLVAMAILIGICIYHLHFQIVVAKRRLPQFNKKGARYDEN